MTAPGGPVGWVEWAVAGRPFPGESRSGDTAVHAVKGDHAVVAVIDGLGHGGGAAAVAERAAEVVSDHAAEAVETILTRVHEELRRTRGVTATIASIAPTGRMRWVGVGNVEAHVLRFDGRDLRRVASAVLYGGVVGYQLPGMRVSSVDLTPGDVVLLATDGIAPDFTDHAAPGMPLDALVATILGRCARPKDDALVAAARYTGAP